MATQETIEKEVPTPPTTPETPPASEPVQQAITATPLAPPTSATPQILKRKRPDADAASDSSTTHSTVDLIAGPQQHRVNVPAQILHTVPFFRAVLENLAFRNEEPAIHLPDHWPGPVWALLYWLRYEKIDPDIFVGEERAEDDASGSAGMIAKGVGHKTADPVKLFPIYQLAKAVGADERFQNQLMNLFVRRFRTHKPRGWLLGLMVDGIPTDDKLLDLLMQLVAMEVQGPKGWAVIKAGQGDWHTDFAKGRPGHLEFVLDAMAKYPEGKREGKRIWEVGLCEWHVHEVSEKCSHEGGKEAVVGSVANSVAH